MSNLVIKEITDKNQIPWDLLLDADPSRKVVEEYLTDGKLYGAYLDQKLIGEFVLVKLSNTVWELKNIAVAVQQRGKGFGKMIVMDAIKKAKDFGAKRIEVGTGNSSLNNIAMYQKCGFKITGIEKDFFVKNYKEEILENGIKCTDMIRMSIEM